MAIASILEHKLKRRNDLRTVAWDAWEHKNANRHCGVLFQHSNDARRLYSEIETDVREQARSIFGGGNWLRGLAFGVVLELPKFPDDMNNMIRSIDSRSRNGGAWLWTVLAGREEMSAIGIHSWTQGYLTSLFAGVLQDYQSEGYRVTASTKPADGLMKFLLTARRWLHGGFIVDIVQSAQAEDPPPPDDSNANR